MVLTTSRRAPQNLSLRHIQLESVGPHPVGNGSNAIYNTTLKTISVAQPSEAVDLRIVGSLNDLTSCTKFVVYSRKRTGPRAEPCGTPLMTGVGIELDPEQRTDWKRPVR